MFAHLFFSSSAILLSIQAELASIASDAVAAIDSAAAERSASVGALVAARAFAPSALHTESLAAHRATVASAAKATLAMLSSMTDTREARCAARERSADEEKASLDRAAASMRAFVEATTSASGGFLSDVATFSAQMSLGVAAQFDTASAANSAFGAAVRAESAAMNAAAQKLAAEEVRAEAHRFLLFARFSSFFVCSSILLLFAQVLAEAHTSETPSKSTVEAAVSDAPSPFASPARSATVVDTASAAIGALGDRPFCAKVVISDVMSTVGVGYSCVTPVNGAAATSACHAMPRSPTGAAPSAADAELLEGQILEEHSILEEQIAKIDSSPTAAESAAAAAAAADADVAAAACAAMPPQPPLVSERAASPAQEEVAPAAGNARASRRRGGKPVPRPLRKKTSSGLSKTPGRKTPGRAKKDGGVKTRRSRRLATSEMTPNSPREMR